MSYLVIPNEAYANSATIWVATINENLDPASATLEYGSKQIALNDGWSDFQTADRKYRIRYQRVTLNDLEPKTRYVLTLRIGGQWKAEGSVTTMPYRLPGPGERPFIVMLGSCFFGREDPTGAVGQTYMGMPPDARPDVKILCGDQVYLDNPPQDFLNPLHGRDWLETRSFKTYADTWSQQTSTGGFGQLLKHGANFFSSDDHEYWNNAPDVGLNVPIFTLRKSRRDDWWDIARTLYRIFQTVPGAPIRFKIEPLSFCITETRFNRGSGGGGTGDFISLADLEEIGKWTAGLEGPGILVLGQPFFAVTGSKKDYGLPDFKGQYEKLKRYLRQSEHSIAILTGDVHFGRIAVTNLSPELGTKLYEVISSPMQLVPGAKGKYEPAPAVFGQVTSEVDFSHGRNHFLTLEFTAPSPRRAAMVPKFWPIVENGKQAQPHTILSTPIELF